MVIVIMKEKCQVAMKKQRVDNRNMISYKAIAKYLKLIIKHSVDQSIT